MAENNNDVLHVEGGRPLNGTIKVRGAKNFVSKAMVAALLAPVPPLAMGTGAAMPA